MSLPLRDTDRDVQFLVRPLTGPRLLADYQAAATSLAGLYAGHPQDIHAWKRTAQAVDAYFDPTARTAMASAIRPTSQRARAKLEAISAGRGFFIQTGQQAGLLGGPLYTVHKIITAINLAAELESRLGVPVAPLFWTAADDHDFDEVNHAHLVSEAHELIRVELRDDGGPPASMARRRLGADVQAVLARVREALPATAFAERLLHVLHDAYRPGHSIASAFDELIAFLFAEHDLLMTSSAHPQVKRLGAPSILRELEAAEAHEDAINEQTQKLIARGYHEQVPVRSDAVNVSYEDEHGRDRLLRVGQHWELSRSRSYFSKAEIAAQLETHAERFSANALLRPVVASAIFPTIGYVGGPAEISYFGQIGCLFAGHGVPMPVVVPRASVDIVERKVQKVLDKFELDVDDVRRPWDRLSTMVARGRLPTEITTTLAQLRDQLAEGYDQLAAAAASIDPVLRPSLEAARTRSHHKLDDVQRKIVRHLKRRDDIGLDQVRRASTYLYPNGQPQERTLSVITYYARYGPALLTGLRQAITPVLDGNMPEWTGVEC